VPWNDFGAGWQGDSLRVPPVAMSAARGAAGTQATRDRESANNTDRPMIRNQRLAPLKAISVRSLSSTAAPGEAYDQGLYRTSNGADLCQTGGIAYVLPLPAYR
jgi:hypothetical protein